MTWEEDMGRLIKRGCEFPLGIFALIILIPPAFVYYVIKDLLSNEDVEKD